MLMTDGWAVCMTMIRESPEVFEAKLAALEAAKQAEVKQRAADRADAAAQALTQIQVCPVDYLSFVIS